MEKEVRVAPTADLSHLEEVLVLVKIRDEISPLHEASGADVPDGINGIGGDDNEG